MSSSRREGRGGDLTLLFLSRRRWRSLARRIWTPSCGFTVNYLIVRVPFVVSAVPFTIDPHTHTNTPPPPPSCTPRQPLTGLNRRITPRLSADTAMPLKAASGCGGVTLSLFSFVNQTEGHSSRPPPSPASLCLKYANEIIRRRRRALQLN